MNLKKILAGGIIILLVFIIYLVTIDKKIYYIALGDSLALGQNPYGQIGYGYSDYIVNYLENNNLLEFHTKKFAISGYRTVDLINDINRNKKITVDGGKELSIKNALIKADLITLSIGANDLFYKMGINDMVFNLETKDKVYGYIDEIIIEIDFLLEIIRKYCKEDIVIVGYYNPLSRLSLNYTRELEPIFLYANNKLEDIAVKHRAHFVNIYEIFLENSDYLPNPLDIHPSTLGYEVISTQIIDVIETYIIN